MPINPYEIISLPKDCSEKEIRDAYRNLSKTHHPDVGGDPEQFKKIKFAHDLLLDPDRRKKYDEYGFIDGDLESMKFMAALKRVQQMFWNLMGNVDAERIEETDILGKMRHNITEEFSKTKEFLERVPEIQKNQKKMLSALEKRLKQKNKDIPNILMDVMNDAIKGLPAQIAHAEEQKTIFTEMLKILDGFSYDFIEPMRYQHPNPQSLGSIFNIFNQ